MPVEVKELGHRSRIVTAKNQTKIMEIFDKFPTEEFTQRALKDQTQIKYPASVHSALMALVKKNDIVRIETPSETGNKKLVTYKKRMPNAGIPEQEAN